MSKAELVSSDLVIAARAGDRQALERLIEIHLPLLYNVVGRSLNGHSDVDDVVQETWIQAVRDLPGLRDPASFRSWLMVIAIRRIGAQRRARGRERNLGFDDVPSSALPSADFEDLTIMKLALSGQRREVAQASRWLDSEDRVVFALWWQEETGDLTRAEVSTALGVSVPHAGVRLQRMRQQLEIARGIVCALAEQPQCPDLQDAMSAWDGVPSALWRKRMARHVRGCPSCSRSQQDRVPVEKLLTGLGLVPVPLPLVDRLSGAWSLTGGSAGAGAKASLFGRAAHALGSHPVAVGGVAAAVVAAGGIAYVAGGDPPTAPTAAPSAPARPSVTASRSRSSSATPRPTGQALTAPALPPVRPAEVPLGRWSLESADVPGAYVAAGSGDFAALLGVTRTSSDAAKRTATLQVVRGLADPACVTFRAADGRYLRHFGMRLRMSPKDSTKLFREDATFCPEQGAASGSVAFRSQNMTDFVLRWMDGALWLGFTGQGRTDRAGSFMVRSPWTR